MQKIRFIKLLILFSVLFLALQLFLYRYLWTPNVADKNRKEIIGQRSLQFKAVLKTFIDTCVQQELPVFIISPDILRNISQGNTLPFLSDVCGALCDKPDWVPTFGLIHQQWQNKENLVHHLQQNGFRVTMTSDVHPHSTSVTTDLETLVPAHFFLFHRDLPLSVIHLLIFYEQFQNYFWHGRVRWSTQPVLNTSRLHYGLSAGLFTKFNLKLLENGGLLLSIPSNPGQFLQEFPHSTFLQCNHTRAKLFYSQYERDKTEEAVHFQRKARQVLARSRQLMEDLAIPFWLSSGTCLGWYRQCDIIPYSKDIDFGIWVKHYKPELLTAFEKGGFYVKHIFGKVNDSYELSFQAGDVKVDMFFFYEEAEYMWNGGTQAKSGKKYKYIFPKLSLCWTEFLDLIVRVPCQSEAYIQANYGKDWFIPVKQWDWKISPSNVQENGLWPEDEWDTVIQVY